MARAGPGIWPFGHSEADRDRGSDVRQYLALYTPRSCMRHEDITCRRLRHVPPGDMDRRRLVAYLILQDLLREFVRYREVPLGSRPTRKSKRRLRGAEPRVRPFQVRARMPGERSAVVTDTALYTSLLIPVRPHNADREQDLHKFWTGALQPQEEKKVAVDEDNWQPSSLHVAPVVDGLCASALLGDPSTEADDNCRQFQAAVFAGRLEEVVVRKQVGASRTIPRYDMDEPDTTMDAIISAEETVLDFDSFCRAVIVENDYLATQCPIRRGMIHHLMLGQPMGGSKGGEAATTTTTTKPDTTWTEVFRESGLSPFECLRTVEDFLFLATQLDQGTAWMEMEQQFKDSGPLFSTFFGLKKQLRLIPKDDVHPDFLQIGRYWDEPSSVLRFSWPALRIRYSTQGATDNDLDWISGQQKSNPIPADLASYDERRFQEWKRQQSFSFANLSLEETALGLPSLYADPRDSVAAEHLVEQRTRALYAQNVGIGANVHTISEEYLRIKNTEQKTKIEKACEVAIAALDRNDAQFASKARRERSKMHIALRQFKAQAAIEVSRCIFHPEGTTSDAIRSAAKHAQDYLLRNDGRIDIGFAMHSDNLTIMGNFWTLFSTICEVVFDFLFTHDMITVLLAATWSSGDPAEGLRPNTLQEGEFAVSKSWNFVNLCKMVVGGMVDLVTDKTINADTDNRTTDGGIDIYEEANESWFMHNKMKGGDGNKALQQWKAKLTRNKVVKTHCWIDKETGERRTVRSENSCKRVYHFSTNSDTRKFDPAMLSRFLRFYINRRFRPGLSVSDFMTSRPNDEQLRIREFTWERLSMIHALITASFTLEKCGVIAPVNTAVTDAILNKVRHILETQALPSVPDRVTEMFMFMVRSVTVARALFIRFGSPNSMYYMHEFRSLAELLKALVTLEFDLVDADPTICVHLMSLMESNIIKDQKRFEIVEALLASYCQATPWVKSASGGGLAHFPFETPPAAAPPPVAPTESSRKRKRNEDPVEEADEKWAQELFDGPSVRLETTASRVHGAPAVPAVGVDTNGVHNPPQKLSECEDHSRTCFCASCLQYHALYIDAHEKSQCRVAQQPDLEFENHERMVRAFRYRQNKLVRQHRYLELYSRLADENGQSLLGDWKRRVDSLLRRIVVRRAGRGEEAEEVDGGGTEDEERWALGLFDAEIPRDGDESVESWLRHVREKLDTRAWHVAKGGVYIRIENVFGTVDDGESETVGSNGLPIVREYSKSDILNRMTTTVYNYMKTHAMSTPSPYLIYKTLDELTDTSVPAHSVEFPTKDDSGLGQAPPSSSGKTRSIKMLHFFRDGSVGLAARLCLNNVVEPLRCIVQEALEYEYTVPRSYPFSLYSADCPLLYSTISALPCPGKPFVTNSVRQVSKPLADTLQHGIFTFRNMQPKSKSVAPPVGAVVPPPAPTPSLTRALAPERPQRLDRPIEDLAYSTHVARLGASPAELELLASAPETVLCRTRIRQQEEFLRKRKREEPHLFSANEEHITTYPGHLIRAIRRQQEVNIETRKLTMGTTNDATNAAIREGKIASALDIRKAMFPHGEDVAVEDWYRDLVHPRAAPVTSAAPAPSPSVAMEDDYNFRFERRRTPAPPPTSRHLQRSPSSPLSSEKDSVSAMLDLERRVKPRLPEPNRPDTLLSHSLPDKPVLVAHTQPIPRKVLSFNRVSTASRTI